MPSAELFRLADDHLEVVLCDGAASFRAHRELYRLPETAYHVSRGPNALHAELHDFIQSCKTPGATILKLHITVEWRRLLHICVGRQDVAWGDIMLLLNDAGISSAEMLAFRDAEYDDIFPWLYYAKRLDVLRKLCRRAKKQVDVKLAPADIRAACHLASADTQRIVASSL
ncbi:MAG TPA: hypothetical protein VK445_02165 [Dissulfurispiraceae bacterium]|nr:hypothetical protein [Dissulfurispiraceae bacterium]